MKTLLNSKIKGKKINEVLLFEEMAIIFNSWKSKCTFVKKTHKWYIEYYSIIKWNYKKIEISDLLFITLNKKSKEIKICFLQAKYKKEEYKNFITFKWNIYQWELLKEKPNITNSYGKNFPHNVLNFRNDYDSITSFWIFYLDKKNDIDFLYTLPKFIKPNKTTSTITNMNFKWKNTCPNVLCKKWIFKKETISTCSIDVFEKEMLNWNIWVPINNNPKILWYIYSIVSYLQKNWKNNETINSFINIFEENFDINTNESINYNPNTIILINDNEIYNYNQNNL